MIYKICSETEWKEACAAGVYTGSADDKRDGFIHLSTKSQIKRTLSKHFAAQEGLLLLAIDVSLFKPQELKYEDSGKGERFPHLYGGLSPSMVNAQYVIRVNDLGEHDVDF